MKTFNKTLIALSIAGLSMSAAQAQDFYIDLDGTGVGNGFADATNCPTCTSDAEELTFRYNSETTITLGDFSLDVGDTIQTMGGLNVGNFDTNFVSGFSPAGALFGFSSTSFAGTDDWGLSFDMVLDGTVAATDGSTVSEVKYTGGTINVYLVEFDGIGGVAGTTNIMDLIVTGSKTDNASNFIITGNVDFTGIDPTYEDMFNLEGADCLGDNSFSAIVDCPMEIDFVVDQNLDSVVATIGNGANGVAIGDALIAGEHDGSLRFTTVPEPGTLFLMGGVLVGMAGAARRAKKA